MTDKVLNAMRAIHELQGRDGNWNYDPYMCGLYNGMELMLAIAEERKPVYRDPKDLGNGKVTIDVKSNDAVMWDEDRWSEVSELVSRGTYGRGY